MNLFIDSSQPTFVAAIINNNFSNFKSVIKTKYKVEEIINFFNQAPDLDKVTNIYINLGPGSFVGTRVALLYIRTWAQIKNVSVHVSNTFELLNFQNRKHFWKLNNKFYIYATKNKSYLLSKNKITIKEKSLKELEIDYLDIIENFDKYIPLFKSKSLTELKPIYASEPQIGSGLK